MREIASSNNGGVRLMNRTFLAKFPTKEMTAQNNEALPASTASIPVFLLVWFGQVVSLIGSGLTGFALAVWVYQQTGSATRLSIVAICSRLPGIVISPLAGALVDRWDRRLVMLLSDLGAGMSILSMALAMFAGHLFLWHICVAVAINSALSAFQWPAYAAATTLLIPKKQFGRASGLVTTGDALGQLISPVLGGVLVVLIKIQGVFLLDFATFFFSLAILLSVRIPRPLKSHEETAKRSLWKEVSYGWTYVASRPGLWWLLIFFALTNFFTGFALVLTTPLVLSFTVASVLGTVLSVGGLGLLIGSLVMSAWGGPRRKMIGVFSFEFLGGLCLIVAGLRPSARIVAVTAFCFFLSRPFIYGCSQAIWQSKTPPDVQGRVFAARRMIAWSVLPLAYLTAGPLADYVFEPLLAGGGALASTVGRIIGTGPGRGIGFLFITMGVLTLLMVSVGYLHPRLRFLEDELTDSVPDASYAESVSP